MGDASVRVDVDGLRRLRKDLRAMGDDLSDVKDANAGAARVVADDAARRAPKRTGRLAASIRGNRAASRATVSAGGARLPYGGPIHYGWPGHGIEPHPFITDAAQATEATWLPLYEHHIEQAVDKVAGRTY